MAGIVANGVKAMEGRLVRPWQALRIIGGTFPVEGAKNS